MLISDAATGASRSARVLTAIHFLPPTLQVVAYGISINLVEVTWKSKIKAQFPNPNDYSSFMGDFSTATGAVTFTMMILSRYIFRYFGWGTAALITPTVLLITGKCMPWVGGTDGWKHAQCFLNGVGTPRAGKAMNL